MKLQKEMVDYLAHRVADYLEEKEIIEYECDSDKVVAIIAGAITRDLAVEDELNDEVKQILSEQESEIDEQNINYRKVFQMVKGKLARERGLIL